MDSGWAVVFSVDKATGTDTRTIGQWRHAALAKIQRNDWQSQSQVYKGRRVALFEVRIL